MASSLNCLLSSLNKYRYTMNAAKGREEAIKECISLGGTAKAINEDDTEYTVLEIDNTKIHVWQVYPDIDRIYYEY